MKYQFHILIISAVIISSFSFNNAYASGPLSFDQTSIIINHSGVISCIGCTDVGNSFTVILGGGVGTPPPITKTITLYKVPNSSPLTYSSNLIKFTDCSTCGTYEYDVISTNIITATASGYTSAPTATIYQTDSSLDNSPSKYGKNFKPIKPWSYGLTSSFPVCFQYHGDTDGDTICNDWEDSSVVSFPPQCLTPASNPVGKGLCIRTPDATSKFYYLSCNNTDPNNLCPSKDKADVYYEIDWMRGHKPDASVIPAIINTFATSNYVSANGITGISFHAQLDEELPLHVNSIPWAGSATTPGFDQLKYWWFGTAAERTYSITSPTGESLTSDWINNDNIANKRSLKGQVFHYAVFGHSYSEDTSSSGNSEIKGNDLMVSLGTFDGMVGTKDMQQGTFLHEIGHNLSLDHGGVNNSVGCKPNYLSVMSYTRQSTDFVNDRKLDFSQSALPSLNEGSLSEPVGVTGVTGVRTVYGQGNPIVDYTGIPLNWDRDTNPADTTDTGIIADINNISGIGKCGPSSGQTLTGSWDWDRTKLYLTPLGAFGGGEGDRTSNNATANAERLVQSYLDGVSMTSNAADELSSEDVTGMRISRIDSLLTALDNIPDSDFKWYAPDVRELYHKELNEVKIDIMKNYRGDNTMGDAYNKMLAFQGRLDGNGTNEIISNKEARLNILNQTADIILSQSHTLPEFSTFSILVLAAIFGTIVFFSKKHQYLAQN